MTETMTDTQNSCIFCNIVAGKAPAYVVEEDDLTMCILDIHPYAKGHCLVIPKRHVPWWHELTDEEHASLFKMAKTVGNRIMERLKPDFVYLYARGTQVPHTHIFLIPTSSGDVLDRFLSSLENFQVSLQGLAEFRSPSEMEDAARILRKTD
ncbi:MAG: HIT-like protein [Syntrophus sp. PtaB.Bin001]|jgi:histidine triad (HIT) family protein|nr:MAG: HIT-like protein [Syntrophus sp. PtaB.Bin001]